MFLYFLGWEEQGAGLRKLWLEEKKRFPHVIVSEKYMMTETDGQKTGCSYIRTAAAAVWLRSVSKQVLMYTVSSLKIKGLY